MNEWAAWIQRAAYRMRGCANSQISTFHFVHICFTGTYQNTISYAYLQCISYTLRLISIRVGRVNCSSAYCGYIYINVASTATHFLVEILWTRNARHLSPFVAYVSLFLSFNQSICFMQRIHSILKFACAAVKSLAATIYLATIKSTSTHSNACSLSLCKYRSTKYSIAYLFIPQRSTLYCRIRSIQMVIMVKIAFFWTNRLSQHRLRIFA